MTDREELRRLLETFPVVVEMDVAWADMDYFRHVNNTVFFRYFESARIA
jgi:acyl-CoA thioester hydrolase